MYILNKAFKDLKGASVFTTVLQLGVPAFNRENTVILFRKLLLFALKLKI